MRHLFKSVSVVAMAASLGASASTPTLAADLGGNCCADLEERVAELEATTARKGNRKVSLQIYGQISEMAMFWDDGKEQNTYIAESSIAKNIIGFQGTAKINSDWFAAFKLEYQARSSASKDLNQLPSGDNGGITSSAYNTQSLSLRHAYWQLGSATFGSISVGQTSTATSGIVNIDLGGVGVVSVADINNANGSFRLRNKNGTLTGEGLASDGVGIVALNWSNLVHGGQDDWDTSRRNIVRYASPTWGGFSVTAAWGEDDFWDAALRYAGEFGGFRVAAGIGYREDRDFALPSGVCTSDDCDRRATGWLGSGSVMHVASGLFVTGGGGKRNNFNIGAIGSSDNRDVDSDFWQLTGGISKNFFGPGNTVVYGEYAQHNDGLRPQFTEVTASEVTFWGFGVIQNIDAAALELFASYKHYEANFDRNNGTLANPNIGHVEFKDFDVILTGARIKF
jgi:predicted porin